MTDGGECDWYNVARALLHGKPNIKPRDLLEMDLTELAIALDAPDPEKPMTPSGAAPLNPVERAAYMDWWRKLDLKGRIEHFREAVL